MLKHRLQSHKRSLQIFFVYIRIYRFSAYNQLIKRCVKVIFTALKSTKIMKRKTSF